MDKGVLKKRRGSRHLLFWFFPVVFAVVLAFVLLVGMGSLYPRAVTHLEKLLALVMNI